MSSVQCSDYRSYFIPHTHDKRANLKYVSIDEVMEFILCAMCHQCRLIPSQKAMHTAPCTRRSFQIMVPDMEICIESVAVLVSCAPLHIKPFSNDYLNSIEMNIEHIREMIVMKMNASCRKIDAILVIWHQAQSIISVFVM